MRKLTTLVLALSLAGVLTFAAEEFPPLPSRTPIENFVWTRYTMNIARQLFSTRPWLSEKWLSIVESNRPFAQGDYSHTEISVGMIREVKDANEYASMLAHELGHDLLRHHPKEPIMGPNDSGILVVLRLPTQEELIELRLEDSEADLIAVLTTGSVKGTYDLLERGYIPDNWEPYSWVENEIKKIILFRMQILRNMREWNVIKPIIPANPLPRPLPEWGASKDAWENYIRRVLHAMYPNYEDAVDKLIILLNKKGELAFPTYLVGGDISGISLNMTLLEEVISSPEELAVLLGHEFGHTMVGRYYDRDYKNTGISFVPREVAIRKQNEADLIGVLPLPRGECIWGETLQRINDLEIKHSELRVYKYDKEVDDARVKRLRAMCASH